ncbi:MAG: hypothetical protein V1907_02210 [Candidatus Kerfeldbacteria bacterium]
MQRIILHLDMNSYFASVEQQANPFYRGKPLGVCATMTRNGCIIASSKEAKKEGIKVGCRVQDARAIDPNVILVEVDPPKYRSTTEKIFSILAEYSEDIEPYSIDEAFVNLTGFVADFDAASELGRRIKQRILGEVGEWLTCSMGIAATRWLAKFGADTCEKGGLVVLTADMLDAYLTGRELTEAWGIADRTAAKLMDLGIRDLLELKRYPVANLIQSFGMRGYELWANLNAIELSRVQTPRPPKSVGHSHVLRRRTNDQRFHEAVLLKLCEKTGRRLRSLDMEAGALWCGFGTTLGILGERNPANAGGFSLPTPPVSEGVLGLGSRETRSPRTDFFGESVRLPDRTADTRVLFRTALDIFRREHMTGIPSFFAVYTFDLAPVSRQLSLFGKPRTSSSLSSERCGAGPKDYGLQKALDEINDRYGEYVIVPGSMLGLAGHHVPDRIGYRKTVGWDITGIDPVREPLLIYE